MNRRLGPYFFCGDNHRIVIKHTRAVAICFALLGISLAGCSVQPTTVIPATSEHDGAIQKKSQTLPSQKSVEKAYEPSARTNTAYLSPAAEELVSKATRYSSSGDSVSALRYLERAQRISPRAPQVYLAMAEVRLKQGETRQARQLANKALSLVGDDDDLKQAVEGFLNEL